MLKRIDFYSFLIIFSCFCIVNAVMPTSAESPTATLEVVPDTKWDEYLPTPNDVLSFTVNLDYSSDNSAALVSTTYVFGLVYTSSYPGYCMNAGDVNDRSPDIIFRLDDQHKSDNLQYHVSSDAQTMTIVCVNPVSSITLKVFIKDYAAHSLLTALAQLNDHLNPDGSEKDGTRSNNGVANTSFAIPLDNNGNDIADCYAGDASHVVKVKGGENRQGLDPWADDETGPGDNTFHGDGFTVFEEYRGFMVNGEHIRTLPTDKDVFVHSELPEGYGYASNLPKVIKLWTISYDEMNKPVERDANNKIKVDDNGKWKWLPDPCVMNTRQTAFQVVKQRAIWIHNNDDDKGWLPGTRNAVAGKAAPGGPPHQMKVVYISYDFVKGHLASATEVMGTVEPNETAPDVSVFMKRLIGHEFGHAITLHHPWYEDRVGGSKGTMVSETPDTIMDYGRIKAGSTGVWNQNRQALYSKEEGDDDYIKYSDAQFYLKLYYGSKEYPAFHNNEYQLVAPDVRKKHLEMEFPDREDKPEWSDSDTNDQNNERRTETPNQISDPNNPNNIQNPDNTQIPGTSVTVPTKPLDLVATAKDASADLEWKVPTSNGGSAITDYKYRYRIHSTKNWSTWASAGSDLVETVTGLTNGTTYKFQVVAVNSVGDGPVSNTATAIPILPPRSPDKPTSLTATAGNASVVLSWTAPADTGTSAITRYEYQLTSASSSSWTDWETTGGTALSFTVNNLTNGIVYTFQVRAVSDAGNSPASDTAIATPVEPSRAPSAPRNVKSAVLTRAIAIAWTAPSDPGTHTVTGYKYRYAAGTTVTDSDYGSWSSISGRFKAFWNLQDGTTYHFQIVAVSAAGESPAVSYKETTPGTITVQPTVPGKVTGLTATARNGQVRLAWTAPTQTGGGITGYQYRYDADNDGTWRAWANTNSTSTSKTVTGLTNGKVYAFRVRAKSSGGTGTQSDKVTATPTNTTPSAPVLSATSGDGYISLSWTLPTRLGTGITDYEYQSDKNNDGSWSVWTTLNRTTRTARFSGVTNGTAYAFKVRGVNAAGDGAASNTVVATPLGRPSAPTSLSATAGNASVSLTWTASNSNGGATISGYQYRYKQSSVSTWTDDWTSTGGTSTSYTVSSLANGTSYDFQVNAVNSVGASPSTSTASATPAAPVITYTTPGQPTNLTATASNGSVTLSWTAPSDDGGGISTYEYRTDPNNDGTWDDWTTLNSTATTATLSLDNGRDYGFQVRAKNSAGTSTQTSKTAASPVDSSVTVPSAPQSLSASGADRQVSLSWTAPATGTGIIEYEYRYDANNDGTWSTWNIVGGTSASYTVTGLTNNTEYAFEVRARNAGGKGSVSSSVTATPHAPDPPDAPSTVTAVGGDTKIVLGWGVPDSNGGSAITKYKYRHRVSGGTWGSYTDHTGLTLRRASITGLTNETVYEVEVLAVNRVGDGSSASATATPTDKTTPGAPQSFSSSGNNGAVDLSWYAPSSNGNTPITDYEYKYRESGGTWSSWASTGVGAGTELEVNDYTVTGLTNGTTYDFDVRAVNKIGAGTSAGSISETPAARAPGRPTNLSASKGTTTGTIDLSWTAPDDGGSPITHYEFIYSKFNVAWGRTWTSTSSASTSYTVTGLESGELYRFKVRAINAASGSRHKTSRAARAYAK